jgi:peptidyl-prolyl cis-trans isomerase B (cyclophilin B)
VPTNEQRREQAKRKLERQLVRRAERQKRRRITAVALTSVAVLVVAGGAYFLATRDWGSSDAEAAASTTTEPSEVVDKPVSIPTEIAAMPKRPTPLASPASCEYPAGAEPASKQVNAPAAGEVPAEGTVGVTLGTSVGDLKFTLDRALAPCAVNSFVSLAQQNYFNDTSCHRLTTSEGLQVLQCGDPTAQGSGGPGYSFKDEVFPELTYGRGMLAMANSGPDTNGSQFFIVYGNAQLPASYTVFGSVDPESLKLVDEVANAGTIRATQEGDGSPKTPVEITSASVLA